jgi:Fe-S cluster biogenesis protein NfuA
VRCLSTIECLSKFGECRKGLARGAGVSYHFPLVDRWRQGLAGSPVQPVDFAGGGPAAPVALRRHVEQILDLIRPAVRLDDGDVELVDVSADGVVRVRFLGACIGCPSSSITLQQGIERNLKRHIPEVTAVLAV